MKNVNQLKQFSEIGNDQTGPYFLCYGPDLLTLRSDINKALSAVKLPKLVHVSDVPTRNLPCVMIKGRLEELEKVKMHLATHERYTFRLA